MSIALFNIQHFSIQDGPGIRTTLFLKGCPLNCVWCHNPEGKSIKPILSYLENKCKYCGKCAAVCPNGAHIFQDGNHKIDRSKCDSCGKCAQECCFGALEIFGKNYTVEEILTEVEKDRGFYGENGGVTISGGDPVMQYGALMELLSALKQKGYNVCIETSGYTSSDRIKKIAEYVDTFLYDFKHVNPEKHLEFTGVNSDKILENLYALDEVSTRVVLRCPIIPEINDYDEHFEGIARVANEHPSIKSIELMPYHPLGISKSLNIGEECEYKNDKFLSADLVEKYCEIIRKNTFKEVKVSK